VIRINELPQTFEPPNGAFERVILPMTASDRAKVRRRVVAPDGVELALALPTGTKLWPGQILLAAPTKVYVIEAAPEDVLVIRVSNAKEAAFVGHLIGNLHRDIDIEGDSIVVLHDEPMEERLLRAELRFERTQRPFHGSGVKGHVH
jgi:urease accessory protein